MTISWHSLQVVIIEQEMPKKADAICEKVLHLMDQDLDYLFAFPQDELKSMDGIAEGRLDDSSAPWRDCNQRDKERSPQKKYRGMLPEKKLGVIIQARFTSNSSDVFSSSTFFSSGF